MLEYIIWILGIIVFASFVLRLLWPETQYKQSREHNSKKCHKSFFRHGSWLICV